jgi:carboxyl-terminal processing protease
MRGQNLPLERRINTLSEIFQTIESSFIHWEDASIQLVDLDSMITTFYQKAEISETRMEFQCVMWELFAQLRNAHSGYQDLHVQSDNKGTLSFSMLDLGDDWVVKNDQFGVLQPGDSILSICGKHPSIWYEALDSFTGIANKTSSRIRFQHFLQYFIADEKIEVVFENHNQNCQTVILDRIMDGDERFAIQTVETETTGKWIVTDKTAYIKIPTFSEPRFEERAIELLNKYWKAPALIIDLRGNGGGSTPSRLTKLLMDRPYRWWLERARHPETLWKRHGGNNLQFANDYSYAEWRPHWQEPEGMNQYYPGRIIFLTDRYVGSAAEDFIMPFKDNGRAFIVGECTWGSTGQPVFRHFGEDSKVHIGAIRAYFPNGEPFEGIGIMPDVKVPIIRDDLYTRRDTTLLKALEVLDY